MAVHLNELSSVYLDQIAEKKKEKTLDPVGQEDGDIDNDGDEDESDSYLANRRKAIGKAMGKKDKQKKGKKECDEQVEQYIDFLVDEGYDCSELTWEDMCEEYESLDEGLRSAVKRLLVRKMHLLKRNLRAEVSNSQEV